MFNRLASRIAMAIGTGRQTADTDESKGTQQAQLALPGGPLPNGVPVMQHYGFASRPMPGADHVVICIAGDRTRAVSVASGDQRYRPSTMQPGEPWIWDHLGSSVVLGADSVIRVKAASGTVVIEGSLTVTGDVTAGGISLVQHVHGGVQAGGSDTGAPIG